MDGGAVDLGTRIAMRVVLFALAFGAGQLLQRVLAAWEVWP